MRKWTIRRLNAIIGAVMRSGEQGTEHVEGGLNVLRDELARLTEGRLCLNCQSTMHKRCCARCGAIIRPSRVHMEFCTRRCEKAQHSENQLSSAMEQHQGGEQ